MGNGVCDHVHARVGGHHAGEAFGQSHRRLPVSRSAVPRERGATGRGGEIVQELRRIAGAVSSPLNKAGQQFSRRTDTAK